MRQLNILCNIQDVSKTDQYRHDLEVARQELSVLNAEREALEVRIAKTKRNIALLAALSDEEGTEVPEFARGGLTEAIKTVLRSSTKTWMLVSEIQESLRTLGFPLEKYKAPYAAIATTVNRMAEPDGEVVANRSAIPGGTEYKWVGPSYGAPNSLANQMERDKVLRDALEISKGVEKLRHKK